MENEPSLLDVADEEFAKINKPEQNQEQGSILDIADNEFKQQEEESIKKEFDVSNLEKLKAEGKRLSEAQERMIFDEKDKVPLLESAGKAVSEFLPAAAQSFGQMATGGYELAKEAIVKPVVVGAGYQLGLATAKDTQEAYKEAKNAVRSAVSGVASDIEDTSNLATRAFMFGTSFTDKLQGLSADDRFKRYRLRDDMRNVEQAWREQTPDRAAALLSENPILQKMAGVAAKMQGGTEEEAKAAEKAYSELVLESGLTKDELNQNISAFGEFLSPISIPGGNIPTRAIGKYTGKALQKGGELALKGVVKPLATGVEKTAGAIEKGITGVQTGARKLGEYVSGDPDLLLRGGSIAGLIQAPAITGAILAAKPAAIATKEIARTVKDIASQVDVGGAAGRRGLFERAGRAAESGALTKKLFSPEAMGGLGRAKAADWITRQSNAIVQQGVNGSVLNTMLGIPDIESAEQLGQVAGSGFGIGAFAGSRLVDRASAAIDPRTGLAQKIDTIITPDPSAIRADEDADIKRFLSSVDPDLVPKMEKLGSIDERKNAIQTKIDNLEKQKATTFGPEVEKIKERISKQKKDLEALNKSTPETQKEVLRQVHLAFADEMDLAKTTGKAAGLNNIQVKILDPSEMEGFFRNSYGATLTDAESVIASLTGKPDLSPQESENLINSRRIVDGFYNEIGSAQSARGLAISEGSDLEGNEVPAFMRKKNLQGATIVINGDLVKQLSNEGFNIRNVVGHEMQHALGRFTEVRDMLAPLRRELFDQTFIEKDGTQTKVSKGIYSDDKLDAYADTYAAAMSPSDNGESFKAQFPNQDKLRAYIKEEILSEIAGRSGNVSGGTRAGLDSIGRQVVDWIEVNTQNGALKKIKETLRKGGIIVDDSGDISTVLGAELTPESLAMIRQYQRQLKNLNQSMVYEEDARKEEVEIPITKILSDRTLQEKFKNSDIFEKEQVATMTAPDGSKQEIPIPPNAGVDPFVGTYRIQGGQLVDESGNPMNLGPNITFGTMPDGTQVEVGTRIARNVDGSPKILSNREIEARSRNRGKVIRNAIDSALSKGALQLEDTGNGNYRGVMSEAQVNAVLALPNTIVSPNLKRQILFVNEILRRKDGTRMYMEYQAAMRGGKSRALAPQIRDEIPIGFQFSKQGNFLITTMSVSRMHDKMNAWLAKKPENLKLWNGDTASFWDDVIKVLDNHSKGERGETGLDPDAAIALEKKNAVNDLFNVWNADTKAANPRRTKLPVQKGKDPIDVIVRSRRIDRINQYNESSLKKMPFNYELNRDNYMPAENPLADFQTPEDFANELPSVTAEEIRNAINTGNLDQLESKLRVGDDLKPAESLDEKDGNIRIVSMFDNEFMPQESLDFVDVKPTENDKRINVGISFMPASEEDYAYRGHHKAPDQESGSPLNKVTESIYPDDFYAFPFEKTLQYYGSGDRRSDSESLSAILSAKDKPNAKVKVYRAVPKYAVQIDPVKAKEIEDRISKFKKLARLNPWSEYFKKQLDDALAERPQVISDINAGDWVTPSRSYAADHGESVLNGQYRILSKSVPASHLFTEGNSLSEFGYNPPSAKGIQFMPSETERYPTSERGMYSGLQKTIDEKVQGKFASPDQLKATFGEYIATYIEEQPDGKDKTIVLGRFPVDLKGKAQDAIANKNKGMVAWQSSNKIKEEELKWSGVLGEIDRLAAENQGKVPKDKVMDYLRNEGAVKFEEVTLGGTSTFLVTDVNGEVMGSGGTESDAIADAANALSMDFLDVEDIIEKSKSGYQGEEETLFLKEDEGESDSTKHAQYQLPGGANYREVVMTMPDPKLVRYNELNKIGATYMTDEQFAEYKQLEKSGLYKNQYTSSHFPDTPNYVAHMRLNERTDAQGNKGDFIEEFQSDRHQAGREKGYIQDVQIDENRIFDDNGVFRVKGVYDPSVKFKTKGDALEYIKSITLHGRDLIPDAPFRKDWSIQLFKRALRDAVDADKKWIGWTTGDTQAERYDLSKQVDAIDYSIDEDGLYSASAIKGKNEVFSKEGMELSEVEATFGKELAQKMQENKGKKRETEDGDEYHSLSGLDLKVGGEGMKGFYDTILPKEIGKYVAKMGGKVEKSKIETRPEKEVESPINLPNEPIVKIDAEYTPIWRVDITPEMAGKVRGGQLQFMPAEQPTEYEPISARIRPLEGISAPTKVVGAKALSLGEIEPPVRGKAMLPDMELKPDISEKPKISSKIDAEKLKVSIDQPFDEFGDIDYDVEDAVRKIAKDRNLGITSDRELAFVAKDENGEIVGGAFTSADQDGYTFDVVVSKEAEGKGVGSKLLDKVINPPYELMEAYPDAKVKVDVVNPSMKKMLENRGFVVEEKIGKERWIMVPKKPDISEKGIQTSDKTGLQFMPAEGEELQGTSIPEAILKGSGEFAILRQSLEGKKPSFQEKEKEQIPVAKTDTEEESSDSSLISTGVDVPESVDEQSNISNALTIANSQSWRKGRDFKLNIQNRVLDAAKKAGVQISERTAEAIEYLARVGLKDGLLALDQNPNAIGWYDEKTKQALGVMSLMFPEIATDQNARFAFTWALAVTSNGLKVDKNFELAERVYRQFRKTGKMPTNLEAGQAQESINKGLDLFNKLTKDWGVENTRKFMQTDFTVGEISRLSKDLSPGGEFSDTNVRGSAILGPKIGNGFFSNLYGMFDALTMDRWLVRTWGRWTGTLVEFNPELTELAKNRLQQTIDNLTPEDKARMDTMLKNDISQMGLEYLSVAIQKASMKPEMRQLMNTTATGEEFRKAGNGYAKYMDGQKEAPSGPTERNFIREIFGLMLDELKSYPKYKDLTMADLQAVLWYAEKRLYETAKIKSDQDSLDSSDADGYEDDDAPDYANAAIAVARKKKVPESKIKKVLENIKNDRTTTTRPEIIEGNQPESEQQKSAGGFVGKEKQKFKQYVAVTTARRNRVGNESVLWTYARKSGSDSGNAGILKPKSKKNLGVKYISEWKPGRKLATMFRNNELPPVKFLELDSTDKASAQKFADTLQQSKESSPHGASVYVYPAEDYQGMNLFLSDSGKSGFAVKPDGDIVSVFSMEKGSGRSIMEAAIAAGGKKLDAFDTILPKFYGTHGFVEAARIPWNDEFAPDGWDKQIFSEFNNGEPDVVMMVLDPKFEGEYEPRTDVYTTEYDQAVKMQNSMLKKMEPKRK